jgi:hypothetical protein
MIIGDSNFKTTSGSIGIALLNVPKSLSFDLQSSSGRLEAGGIKASKRLLVNDGPVKITGNSASGGIKFAQ